MSRRKYRTEEEFRAGARMRKRVQAARELLAERGEIVLRKCPAKGIPGPLEAAYAERADRERAAKHAWERDLSTCTEEELRERWDQRRDLADSIDEKGFEGRVSGHNPIYYVAEKVFFANTLRMKDEKRRRYLYEPYHKGILCQAVLKWVLGVTPFHLDVPEEFEGLIEGTLHVDDPDDKDGLLYMAPRDTYKSTFMHGAVPLWVALRFFHLDAVDARTAFLHQKDSLAFKNLRRMRRMSVGNRWLKDYWPEFSGVSLREIGSNKGLVFPYMLEKETGQAEYSIEAAGMGGSLTGGHYDFIFPSDMVTEQDRKSKVVREQTHDAFDALKYVKDTVEGRFVIDGTPYHPHDEYARMEEGEEDSSFITIVCHAVDKWPEDPKEEVAADVRLLHPYRWSVKAINKRRRAEINDPMGDGRDTFSRLQVNCQRTADRLQITDMAWLRYMTQKQIPAQAWMCLFVDPAWKGTHNYGMGDSASLQVWAYWPIGEVLNTALVDGVHSNELTGEDGRKHAKRLMERYGVYHFAPEQVTGWDWATTLERECADEGIMAELIRLRAVDTKIKKPARIVNFLGKVEAGRVYLCEEASPSLLHAFKEQFRTYPECMDHHDDALDCAAHSYDEKIITEYAPIGSGRQVRKADWRDVVFREIPEPGEGKYLTRYCMH